MKNPVGERIKLIRTNRKLSQEAFGKLLKISRSAVCKLESGENDPSDQTVTLLCSEFNVNEDWLRTGAGGEKNMYIPEDMMFLKNAGKLAKEKNKFKQFYLNMLMQLPDEYWDYIYGEFKKFEKEQDGK